MLVLKTEHPSIREHAMDGIQPLTDKEKLERYERFAEGIRDELAETDSKLQELKAQGRTKTATYRQLFANRFMLEEMVSRLDEAGL
jgi:TolB-like protein